VIEKSNQGVIPLPTPWNIILFNGGSKKFWKGGRQFIRPVLIYRKCTQWTIYTPIRVLYGKKATYRKKILRPREGGGRPSPSLNQHAQWWNLYSWRRRHATSAGIYDIHMLTRTTNNFSTRLNVYTHVQSPSQLYTGPCTMFAQNDTRYRSIQYRCDVVILSWAVDYATLAVLDSFEKQISLLEAYMYSIDSGEWIHAEQKKSQASQQRIKRISRVPLLGLSARWRICCILCRDKARWI